MAKHKTSKSALSIAQRRKEVLRLRLQSKSLDAIAEILEDKVGRRLSKGTIHKDITEELKLVRSHTQQDALLLQTMELGRLDMLAQLAGPKAAGGDVQAMNTLLKIYESRRKLLGLDAPVQLQVQQQMESEQDMFINRLESTLDAETFAKVSAAAVAIAEASAAAATN